MTRFRPRGRKPRLAILARQGRRYVSSMQLVDCETIRSTSDDNISRAWFLDRLTPDPAARYLDRALPVGRFLSRQRAPRRGIDLCAT